MAAALARRAEVTLVDGLVIGPTAADDLRPPLRWIRGSHPVPDAHSLEAGRQALDFARRVPADGLLLVLLSGGASALAALPRSPLSLQGKQDATRRLLLAGADIHALNTVRKHLSALKGGQLAAACAAPTLALAVSDVVGDDLSVIGSGPTVPDPSSFADALDVLDRFGGRPAFPPPVVRLLEDGAAGLVPETPKPGDPRLARAVSRVIGSRTSAAEGAAREAETRGYRVVVLPDALTGEAREAGPRLLERAVREAAGSAGQVCVISTGETTVHVTGGGRGGRNQELALAVVDRIAMLQVSAALLSAGSDGIDGPTDAAGAVVDRETAGRAAAAGLAPSAFLAANDAYRFFDPLGDLVRTGPTGTNVGDIQIVLLAPPGQ